MDKAPSFATGGFVSESRHDLDWILKPRNIAVIGATERAGSVGRTILWNLISNPFGGTVFPVTPTRSSVLGIRAYPKISDVPDSVDLAVIVTPAPSVPEIVQECVDFGVRGAIVISAGFKETGPAGAELERQILEIAEGKMRVVGPNCLGVMMPRNGLNATFAGSMARPGNVAFISQSGAICTSVLDWSFKENVGFSAFISVGSMLDVGWGDLIYYLGDDPHTSSIVIYMESVGDARAFLSAAREVAFAKPIIVIKAGRTEAAAQAAASHTGSLTGSDDVLEAAFRRTGVLRVDKISDIFYISEVLAKQPRPRGNRLTIVTNAGGPGVLATDQLIMDGGELTAISEETMKTLNGFLPSAWSHNNPIDILGDADPQRYAKALEVAAADPQADGLLVILTPQAMTDPTATAEALKNYANLGKPVLASWMGGAEVAAGEAILNRANIPTFAYPDTAVRLFNYMWRYSYNLRGIYETPKLPTDSYGEQPNRAAVDTIIKNALAENRTILTEEESKKVLAAYLIPTVPMEIAATADEAVAAADIMGYPIVLKINSRTITHKTDVGGVLLNLADADAVRAGFETIQQNVTERAGAEHFEGVSVQPMVKLEGYELIVGASIDPQFGPVLLFGAGGTLVEVFKDKSLALPPLTTTLARRMMEQTKIYKALHGVRGRKPVDLEKLEKLMVRFSQLVVEQPWIKELDINPLLASPERLLALDARVVLHDADTPEAELPRPAIRPYPMKYERPFKSEKGEDVLIRPIIAEDEPLLVKFHERLSERTVYMRFFSHMKLGQRIAHERLSRVAFIDYNREMTLVATTMPPAGEAPDILSAGRLIKMHGRGEAEFSVMVVDDKQGHGIGTEVLRRLVEIGRDEGLKRIIGYVLSENTGMLHLIEQLGFKRQAVKDDPNIIKVTLEL
ncbi:MAG TPA: bifunctional acetate--CoA ligase family protein/GNAT family N-acetyltransferase [Aggregatilineales bacterium]|nr:bifunctional acetate--CoA ligase family protein/GNAT family N-acetyltransferase [Aggregatilineales bacterium]